MAMQARPSPGQQAVWRGPRAATQLQQQEQLHRPCQQHQLCPARRKAPPPLRYLPLTAPPRLRKVGHHQSLAMRPLLPLRSPACHTPHTMHALSPHPPRCPPCMFQSPGAPQVRHSLAIPALWPQPLARPPLPLPLGPCPPSPPPSSGTATPTLLPQPLPWLRSPRQCSYKAWAVCHRRGGLHRVQLVVVLLREQRGLLLLLGSEAKLGSSNSSSTLTMP
mmetsp:Transcript_18242/g.51129  ORF Transcript_18242/g.51129 Transcript_18242/m.51129 type:complete len:220 (-) Transcript_18242:447-1106(-)